MGPTYSVCCSVSMLCVKFVMVFHIFDMVCRGIWQGTLDPRNRGIQVHYFCFLSFCYGSEMDRQISFLAMEPFTVPLTTGSLYRHHLAFCGVVKGGPRDSYFSICSTHVLLQ